eukprot:CAMPEP_0174907094 /NCGR_PEP_ID=MMETSP0167-20121228/59544_1 /TAXON_ID=38298 /ORGANISM="Rhodella maculata, Strain CCMP736" /LENGTH=231 /DNA_ID=CAMNT_0016150489 /DNA_START=150 /DNA_END=845 /DNA_ORIENTATION=+
MVAEQNLEKKRANLGYDQRMTTRDAPVAILRDRRCRHGSKGLAVDARVIIAVYEAIPNRNQPQAGGILTLIDSCVFLQELLRSDLNERFIPGGLWNHAVSKVSNEFCAYSDFFIAVMLWLLTVATMEILTLQPRLGRMDPIRKLEESPFNEALNAFDESLYEIIKFMHRPDEKKCECLSYVATAVEIGTLGYGGVKRSDIMECAVCEEGLTNPKVCSRCQKVAYCGVDHQK